MNTTKQETKQAQGPRTLSQTEKEKRTAALLGAVARGLFFAALGYLSGILTLPFGAAPFGIALLSAMGKQTPFLFIGLFLSTRHLPHPFLRLSAYGLILLLRALLSFVSSGKRQGLSRQKKRSLDALLSDLFTEPLWLRVLVSILGADFLGLMILVRRDFLFYDLYGLLLATVVAPIGVLLFSGMTLRKASDRRGQLRSILAQVALAVMAVYAARPLILWGIPLSPALALFLSLGAVKQYGLAKGVPAAALLGLTVSPSLTPLFALSALGAAILMPFSVSLAATVALIIGIAYGYELQGLGILTGLFSALLTASLLFSVMDKLFLHFGEQKEESKQEAKEADATEEADATTSSPCRPLTEVDMASLRLDESERRLCRLRQELQAVSEELAAYRDELAAPDGNDLVPICESAFHCCCVSCPNQGLCHGEKRRETEEEMLRLGGLLHAKGSLERADVAASLRDRCARLPDILDELNHHAALCLAATDRGRKAELFAEDYRGMSELVSGLTSSAHGELLPDGALSAALSEELTRLALPICGAAVIGKKRRTVCLRSREREVLVSPSETLLTRCQKRLPFVMDTKNATLRALSEEPPLYELRIPEAERFTIRYAARAVSAEGEGSLCGDSTDFFHGEDSLFYACISDGMGSGREAARTSTLSVKLLRRLLLGGGHIKGVLTLLNSLLRHKGSGSLHECSATVDLLELDLLCGRARFYKCGAAPTYILREGSLVKLRSGTLPIGIMKQVDVGSIPCDVAVGDVIVMMSDGVTQGKEECPWLFDLLQARAKHTPPEQLSDLILNDAKKRGSADDISVAVLKIEAA